MDCNRLPVQRSPVTQWTRRVAPPGSTQKLVDAEFQTRRKPPFVVKRELTATDAMLAQFELVCCDIVSVFLADAVLSNADPGYLAELYGSLMHADEFDKVSIRLVSVPPHPKARAFVQQFIGNHVPALPFEMPAMRKKARVMIHWAKKIGAEVTPLPG